MLTLRDALWFVSYGAEIALLVVGFANAVRGDVAASTNLYVLACYVHLGRGRDA